MYKEETVKEAKELFKSGLSCSEAVLQACNNKLRLGLSNEAIKMATGFAGGMKSGCCCGALTGAIMALSSVKGRVEANESNIEISELIGTLQMEFKEEFKATCCRVLCKGHESGKEDHKEYCSKFVEYAARKTCEILK